MEVGFEAVTVAAVAERVGVTPAAVYNHFKDKDELLYTAGRLAIGRLGETLAAAGSPSGDAHDVAAAFLLPSFRESRRLILELHLAGTRHRELAEHLADWHREFSALSLGEGADEEQVAVVKVLFLLLLGLCHLDDLEALETSASALEATVDRVVDVLYGHRVQDLSGRTG